MAEPKLSDFIRANLDSIIEEWEAFAKSILPAHQMKSTELRDHAMGMLSDIADDLDRSQSLYEQSEKSKGRAPASKKQTQAEQQAARVCCLDSA